MVNVAYEGVIRLYRSAQLQPLDIIQHSPLLAAKALPTTSTTFPNLVIRPEDAILDDIPEILKNPNRGIW